MMNLQAEDSMHHPNPLAQDWQAQEWRNWRWKEKKTMAVLDQDRNRHILRRTPRDIKNAGISKASPQQEKPSVKAFTCSKNAL